MQFMDVPTFLDIKAKTENSSTHFLTEIALQSGTWPECSFARVNTSYQHLIFDKPSTKSNHLIEIIKEEGFCLVNSTDLRTYFTHNGSSVTDLVLYKDKDITIKKQDLWKSGAVPIRKHIPIITELELSSSQPVDTPNSIQRFSRRIEP
ncbi:hypothetical protein ANN_26823 [Periplaneta americana]|uniref:Uncharacterized protein n=1 Tax=Periplaneta americana TaxID=6978 RepID=A0ABQ8RZF3_PERAM|nr:hypothetical protein ANN_26823 [Periplaneta americana]